jgi:hypothetical protein
MKKPSLRFRQVFEHPTHFKVTKPLGNPLIIAKKGLSPSLQGRLRKFAQGGEVRGYDDGGEVMPAPNTAVPTRETRDLNFAPVSLDEQLADSPTAKIDLAPPRAPSLEKIMASPNFVGEEAESAADSAPAVASAPAAATTAPTQAPVTVNVVAPQQQSPVAPTVNMPAAVEIPPVASISTNPINVIPSEAPGMVSVPPPVVQPSSTSSAQAPFVPRARPSEPVAAAASAGAVAPSSAPVKLQPQEITVENLQKLMQQNPDKTPQQLAVDLVKSSLPAVGASPELVAKSVDVLKSMKSDEMFTEGLATQLRGIVNQANTEAEFAQDVAKINDQAVADRLVIAEKNKRSLEALGKRKDILEKAINDGFDPKSFFGRLDTGSKIGSIFSVFAGALAAGVAGTENYALKSFKNLVDRDLDFQKKKYDSIYNQYVRALNDYEAADKLARADISDLAAMQIKSMSARQDVSKVGPAAEILIGKLQADAAKKREEVVEAQYRADVAKSDAEHADRINDARAQHLERMGTGAGTVAGAKPVAAEKNYQLRLRRFEDDLKRRENSSEFTVPNPSSPEELIVIKTRDVPDGRKARSEMLQRVTALSRVEQLDNILSSKRNARQALNPEDVAKIKTLSNEIVENYGSLAKGTTQLVTIAQATLLKDSMGDIPVPYVKWANLAGMSKSSIETLREEGSRALKNSVNNYARPKDPGAAQFNTLFTKKGFAGRVGELPEKPVAAKKLPPPGAGKVWVSKPDGTVGKIKKDDLQNALKSGQYFEVK